MSPVHYANQPSGHGNHEASRDGFGGVVEQLASLSLSQATECLICTEPCFATGTHRIVSLQCGHLFGKNCIENWLQRERRCPQCSANAVATDIRVIYADHVVVISSQSEENNEQIAQLQAELAASQLEVERLRQHQQFHQDQISLQVLPSSNIAASRALYPPGPPVLLDCPFQEKEEAKELGARWNSTIKKWYVPMGMDVSKFARWLPETQSLPYQNERIYIHCPMSEKEEAKLLGALWDPERVSWYIPPSRTTDLLKFEKWLAKEDLENALKLVHNHRNYLKCPYEQKDVVKALGANWDPVMRAWYIENITDLTPFERWLA